MYLLELRFPFLSFSFYTARSERTVDQKKTRPSIFHVIMSVVFLYIHLTNWDQGGGRVYVLELYLSYEYVVACSVGV